MNKTNIWKTSRTFVLVLFSALLALSPLFFLPVWAVENVRLTAAGGNGFLVKYKDQREPIIIDNLESLDQQEEIEFVEPNHTYHISLLPSDTYFDKQWYLKKIQAPQAWDKKRESPDITIAVIDSGVQLSHPDLKNNLWTNASEIAGNGIDDDKNGFIDDINGWDFINNLADPAPKFSEGYTEAGINHGTIVAGIAAAEGNNATGISGVTWRAKIMALKSLSDSGEGDTATVIKAIDYAIKNNADVINLSFVGTHYSRNLDDAVKRAYDAGLIIVAAAGNEQDTGSGYDLDQAPMYPACLDGDENRVIGVAATDSLDQLEEFSSYGHNCVDLTAPGSGIFSPVVYQPDKHIGLASFNTYYDGYWQGTSMAAAVVSGAVALVKEANPRLSSREVISTILDNTDNIELLNPGYSGRLGRGRLNVYRAVTSAQYLLENEVSSLLALKATSTEKTVDLFSAQGAKLSSLALSEVQNGLFNLAAGDITGDGADEIIAAAGKGQEPYVFVYERDGSLLGKFLAYSKTFRGGVNVAAGDVNHDGKDEVIVGAGPGGGPHVRVFRSDGTVLTQFFAYDKNFRGGISLDVGDINGDGFDEIITGAGPGGGPHVRVFLSDGSVLTQFFAYDKSFRGGVNVAAGAADKGGGSKKARIIAAPWSQGGPHIRIFNENGTLFSQFFAYGKSFRGGIAVSAGDIDKDGADEVITAPSQNGAAHIRIFDPRGGLENSFFAYDASYANGVRIAYFLNTP